MFCPKCDRVYLKTKVCPRCGVKLLRAKGKPTIAMGSQQKLSAKAISSEICCPSCGSVNYRSKSFISYSMMAIDADTSFVIRVLYWIAILCFRVKGTLNSYRCRDCGCRWSEDKNGIHK